ncbi:PapD-like protein [Coleophoma crateriformis]|uniref:PapD-like protein n=1 Tax=Coleophoma crateriformis TaxID=565419 RepID=A0A3D8SYP5_9HELO|nr:PapD-like protein [Coleophoma crateriformis]
MSVEIDPTELGFHRPFSQEVSQTLKIRNPNHTPVAFKVKTTAPKQYCVRPNSGRIEPGKEVEVTVLLQAMKQEPPLDAKCRDKFLVQSVAITADKEFSNNGSIWQHVDDAEKSSVMEKKIRVVFLAPTGVAPGATVTPSRKVNGNDASELAPPAYRSPSPPEEAFTPQQRSTVTPSGSISKLDDEPANNKHLGDAKASAFNPATGSARDSVASAVTAVSSSVPTYEELKAQLADAKATISSYGQEGGVRLRKAAGSSGETLSQGANDMATKIQQGTEGVPVQIVAALCLLSFVLAYLFF